MNHRVFENPNIAPARLACRSSNVVLSSADFSRHRANARVGRLAGGTARAKTLPERDGMRRVSTLAENAKLSAALDKVNPASLNNIYKSTRYMYDTIFGCVLPFWYGGFCIARLGFSEILLHVKNE
jgi:hypothetical protein